jgi:hypothetical protein
VRLRRWEYGVTMWTVEMGPWYYEHELIATLVYGRTFTRSAAVRRAAAMVRYASDDDLRYDPFVRRIDGNNSSE